MYDQQQLSLLPSTPTTHQIIFPPRNDVLGTSLQHIILGKSALGALYQESLISSSSSFPACLEREAPLGERRPQRVVDVVVLELAEVHQPALDAIPQETGQKNPGCSWSFFPLPQPLSPLCPAAGAARASSGDQLALL
jgi:hypothetical protein